MRVTPKYSRTSRPATKSHLQGALKTFAFMLGRHLEVESSGSMRFRMLTSSVEEKAPAKVMPLTEFVEVGMMSLGIEF